MPAAKRVAVIGGGFSGLGSIKSLKEVGIEPVCFEKSPYIGGTWRYRDEDIDGMPSIMWTTIINHSKEMGAISNYPPPKHYPNYMRHHELYKLFMEMAEHFDIIKHIRCNHDVVSVKKANDYEETGRWIVTVRNTENGEVTSEVFDGAMVCVGHITYPSMPQLPGMEKFKGKIIHSHSLKKVDAFAGQRVVVVGLGCSALDAAVEISNVADQVYLSSRSGAWIIPRVGPYGVPFDYALLRRYVMLIQNTLSYKHASKYLEKNFINSKFNHRLYGIQPDYHVLSKDPSVNDILPSKLLSGSVVMRKNILCFKENGVVFEGESDVTECDSVIMATGYTWKFPFLEEDTVTTENGRINLYKCIFPPHLKHHTLSIIGFILPFGPGFPLGEIQCRWVAHLLSGQGALPSKDEMMKDVIERYEYNLQRYTPSDKTSVRVDYIAYMDEIASQFGVKPNLWRLLFTDPKLFSALAFGPSLPYQYRLEGPHKWSGARQAIFTAHERMKEPLMANLKDRKRRRKSFFLNFWSKYLLTLFLISFLISWKESSARYYTMALIMPYLMTFRGFAIKYFLILLLLPFFITWNGFIESYFTILFVPFLIATITSL